MENSPVSIYTSLNPGFATPLVLSIALTLGGCENISKQSERMLGGGAVGVASGTAITVITGGCVACGTAVGGAMGAGVGYVVDEVEKQ
jgi:osmotically inducible lipoprotein OsmB